MTADDIDTPCNVCQYKDYSPFGEPCVGCGFDCHNFKPREIDVGTISNLKAYFRVLREPKYLQRTPSVVE